jgi:hypothetical protein
MTQHHHQEEEENYDNLYYIIGLLAGLFTGLVLQSGFIWIPIMGVFGLLFTAFFLSVFVKGHGED